MTRSAARIWCPFCKAYNPCRSLSPSFLGVGAGNRFYRDGHPDLNYFRRFRECEECGNDFETVEIEAKIIDEILLLRNIMKSFSNKRHEDINTINSTIEILKNVTKLMDGTVASK